MSRHRVKVDLRRVLEDIAHDKGVETPQNLLIQNVRYDRVKDELILDINRAPEQQ